MGGYSNFMNHKTWHPSSMQNQEKVWQAEQAVIRERKRLEAIQKELAKERDISAIRALQNEHGHTKKSQRIEWMYAGARGPSNEEYLLGKELKASLDEDIKAKSELTLKEVPGSTFVNKKTNSLLETEARMREDPLMAIQMEEQSQRHSILKNPVKMKKIKENADLLKKLKKAAKKKRKMERKEKKSGSKRRKEAVSDSDSDGARGRGRERSRSREQNRDRGRREGSRGDRSRNGGGDWGRDRGRRARSRSVSRERRSERGGRSERGRERRRSRSRSPERVKLEEPVPVKQEGRAKVAGGGLQGKYGLIMPAKAKASGLRKADAPADKPASGRVKKEPARRPAARRPAKMSTEERAARLAAMAADGAAHDRDARVRLVKANKAKKEEEDAYLGRNLDEEHQASFITKMNKDIYSGKESLEERMSKHKNSRQRGVTDHDFEMLAAAVRAAAS